MPIESENLILSPIKKNQTYEKPFELTRPFYVH